MAAPKKPGWLSALEKHSPEISKAVNYIEGIVMTEGVLSLKTKVLMMMLCDCLLAHPEGVAGLAARARAMGASDAEINETLAVALFSGGVPAIVTGAKAFKDEG